MDATRPRLAKRAAISIVVACAGIASLQLWSLIAPTPLVDKAARIAVYLLIALIAWLCVEIARTRRTPAPSAETPGSRN